MKRTATISGVYRYLLEREWATGKKAVFVLLNPSTADATKDDPTIRRCIGFAQRWGLGGVAIVNLFAFRSTSPSVMMAADDPIGPKNNEYLFNTFRRARGPIICAWGTRGTFLHRDSFVLSLIREPQVLRLTKKSKVPEHPLYVPYGDYHGLVR